MAGVGDVHDEGQQDEADEQEKVDDTCSPVQEERAPAGDGGGFGEGMQEGGEEEDGGDVGEED